MIECVRLEVYNDLAEDNNRILFENDRLRAALIEIERTCYIPTPQAMRAYTHFQRDFDKIRKLCRAALCPDDHGGDK